MRPALLAIRRLGTRIRTARRLRGQTTTAVAKAIGVSRKTLYSIEQGDPGVSLGSYAEAMGAVGMNEDLELLVGAKAVGETRAATVAKNSERHADQEARELREAIALHDMRAREQGKVLRETFHRLQARANAILGAERAHPKVVYFRSLREKNRHDEKVEMERALRRARGAP
jgi:transcriptional regulator with XRE-family HTH domain